MSKGCRPAVSAFVAILLTILTMIHKPTLSQAFSIGTKRLHQMAAWSSLSSSPSSAVCRLPSSIILMNKQNPSFTSLSMSTKNEEKELISSSSTQTTAATTVVDDGDIILYDGICNFCNAWVDILLRLDSNEQFRFAPLQSDIGRSLLTSIGKQSDDISSVLLIRTNEYYYDKSDCVLQVVKELGPIGKVFSITTRLLVPKFLRNSMYDMVAENRYKILGKRTECRCSDPQFAHRFVS